MDKDYYSILGVSRDASNEDLKRAYRSLSKRYHPDLQQGKSDSEKKDAENKFKEINEAYSVLGDQEKRQNYDRFGTADVGGRRFGSGGFDPMEFFRSQFGSHFGGFDFGFGDDFDIHPRRDDPNAPKDGKDVKISMEISFEEALYGVTRDFDIKFRERCDHCKGTGSDDGKTNDCPMCGGRGMVSRQIAPNFIQSTTCPKCHGEGKFASTPCHKCHGERTVPVNHHINVRIPMGVDNGDVLRVPGEGEHGINGGSSGDLYIALRVEENKLFQRMGNNLQTVIYVPAIEIGLKNNIDVHTPWGVKTVRIPSEQYPNGTYAAKIPECGVRAKIHGVESRGDLHVIIVPETIKNPTDRQLSLMRELLGTITDNNLKLKPHNDKAIEEFERKSSRFKK